MSMNLCFSTIKGNHHVEFPFQTPTILTNKVMALGTRGEKLAAIKQYFIDNKYFENNKHNTSGWAERTLAECERMLNDPTLRLERI